MSTVDLLASATWRKSSFSGSGGPGGGDCVEAAHLPTNHIALRDSKNPNAGTLLFPQAELTTWLAHVTAG